MSEDTRRVLDLLSKGKISVDEAQQLLDAIKTAAQAEEPAPKSDDEGAPKPRYIRINVHKAAGENQCGKDVNIRVPIAVVRSGMRLGAIIPGLGERITAKARERGFDLDLGKMNASQIDGLLRDLGEMTIDVDEGRQQVRICCE